MKQDFKQSDIAAITGLPQQYVSLIEAGQQNITIKTMALLAEVVDRDLLDLLREVPGSPIEQE